MNLGAAIGRPVLHPFPLLESPFRTADEIDEIDEMSLGYFGATC